ncbi:MAG: type IV-A pilus assembly ATPase PilB [Nitrospiraceae bacterium]|nr:type IV-A pilus assembly ATPase PilB [Nitrospiraceae bacterium]
MTTTTLGQMLVSFQVVTEEQLKQALALQRREGIKLGGALVKLGYISEKGLLGFLSRQYGLPSMEIGQANIDPAVIKLIPGEMAKKYQILPVARVGATLTIASADPSNVFAIDDVKFMTGYNVDIVLAGESELAASIANYYGGEIKRPGTAGRPAADSRATAAILEAKDFVTKQETGEDQAEDGLVMDSMVDVEEFDKVVGSALDDIEAVEEKEDGDAIKEVDAPIVKLVNGILVNAIKARASDIHLEPYEASLRVRYRVDGVLYNVMNLPVKIRAALTSRIKIMSRLDIAERRLPQDGRIKLKLGRKREIDFRVSVLPCLFGEKTVLRILDKSNLQVDLAKLGFEEGALGDFMAALDKPYGMILVTGPTGSGKTTTLYSALNYLNKPGTNIMSAEDPVEYNFVGINQVHVREDIGLTFASALRSFLRQDPDIIMVGEIRDFETAEIAIKAALTGHLVLSTIHTNDAPATINRLLNMGIEPFLVSSSVILILAQRLARRICAHCKEEEKAPRHALLQVGFSEEEADQVKIFRGKGCPACNNTGYRGRVALYEVMVLGEELKQLILEGAPADELKKAAMGCGMKTLRMSGLAKAREGITTIEEVLRVSFGN